MVLTRRGLPRLSQLLPNVAEAAGAADDLDAWLDEQDVPEGTPFLVSPALGYDIDLNRYFLAPVMAAAAQNTRLAAAGDLCRFLRFLAECRGGRSWREAGEDDHAAYLHWRRFDPAGPRVAASTWNRELALVSGFFTWAVRRGLVAHNPVAMRAGRDHSQRAGAGAEIPAARARDAAGDRVDWLTPAQYRLWRDCGCVATRPAGCPMAGSGAGGPAATRCSLM